MRAKAFGSIETLSREISVPMRLVPLGEGDFSTPLRFGRNDNKAGRMLVSICFLQTYDKASAAKLSNYPVRNQSFFHIPSAKRWGWVRKVIECMLLFSLADTVPFLGKGGYKMRRQPPPQPSEPSEPSELFPAPLSAPSTQPAGPKGPPPFGALRHHLRHGVKRVTGFSGHCVPLQIQFPCHPASGGTIVQRGTFCTLPSTMCYNIPHQEVHDERT